MMKIRMFASAPDKTFRYEISHGKNALLGEKGFPNKEACLKSIKQTLHAIYVLDMINVSSVGGGYIFNAGKAESRRFKTIEGASDAIALLKEAGGTADGQYEVLIEGRSSEVVSKRKLGTLNEGYDFKQVSKTNEPGFELLNKEKEGLYYFHLNDKEGKPMLFSRSYDGKRRRIKAIRTLIEASKDKKLLYKIVPFKGSFMFILKDEEGYEMARSRTFKQKAAAEEGLKYLRKMAKDKTAIFKLPKKKKKTRKLPKEKFLLQQVAPKGFVGFESFRNPDNKCHYYHYHDKRGQVLLYSPAFGSRKRRENSIEEIIALSQVKDRYVMKEKKDKHYFTIVSEKGKTIARSRIFDSKRDMILGMRHFLENAPKYLDGKNTIAANSIEKIPILLSATKEKIVEREKSPPKDNKAVKRPVKNASTNKEKTNLAPPNQREKPKKATPPPPKKRREPIQPKRDRKPKEFNTANQPRRESTNRDARRPPLKEAVPMKRSTTNVHQPKPINSVHHKKAVTSNESSFKWWWIPLLLILAGLLYFLVKSCVGDDSVVQNAPVVKEEPQKNIKPVKEATPVKKLPTLLGPTAEELNFIKGSAASKIADFLSLPNSVFPKTFLLDQVHFNTNQNELQINAFGQLDKVVQILKAYPTAQVQINGHTDNSGDLQRNQQLSLDRAIRVQDYLIEKGIKQQRISAKGFGAKQPAASNQTDQGKYKNRRSEIVLLRR